MKKWEVMTCPIDPTDVQRSENSAEAIIKMQSLPIALDSII